MRIFIFIVLMMLNINYLASPILKIDTMDLQFGEFPANEAKQGKYVLRNIGDTALTILSVRSTCGCAKPEYPQKIAPGKSATVKLNIGANSYKDKFQGKVYLITNLEEKMVELTFNGEAKPLFVIQPEPEVYIGSLSAESHYEKEFLIHLKKDGIKFGEPIIQAPIPIKIRQERLENKLKIVIKTEAFNSNETQLKFSIEIPVLEPVGWASAKFQFHGQVK